MSVYSCQCNNSVTTVQQQCNNSVTTVESQKTHVEVKSLSAAVGFSGGSSTRSLSTIHCRSAIPTKPTNSVCELDAQHVSAHTSAWEFIRAYAALHFNLLLSQTLFSLVITQLPSRATRDSHMLQSRVRTPHCLPPLSALLPLQNMVDAVLSTL
jgi:hypothetical protein